MPEEDHRNESPDPVAPAVVLQGRDIVQGHGSGARVCQHVLFIAQQIKPGRLERGRLRDGQVYQGGQRINQAGYRVQLDWSWIHILRAVMSRPGSQVVPFLLAALPRFDHLLPEVVGIEDQTVEQEPRDHLEAAPAALISADPHLRDALALGAALKRDRRVALHAADSAAATAFLDHRQLTRTLRTGMAPEDHLVEELPHPLAVFQHALAELTQQVVGRHDRLLRR